MVHYLMMSVFLMSRGIKVALCDVALFDAVLFDVALFDTALFRYFTI